MQSRVLSHKFMFFVEFICTKFSSFFFFLNDPAPTEFYPLPLHAALPILAGPAEWLERHQPPEPDIVRLVHGDYRLDNVIFTLAPPPRLLGVVDWELATLGDPLADLGWLLAFWREPSDDPPHPPTISSVLYQPRFPN